LRIDQFAIHGLRLEVRDAFGRTDEPMKSQRPADSATHGKEVGMGEARVYDILPPVFATQVLCRLWRTPFSPFAGLNFAQLR
jgi:hypothetical protein